LIENTSEVVLDILPTSIITDRKL